MELNVTYTNQLEIKLIEVVLQNWEILQEQFIISNHLLQNLLSKKVVVDGLVIISIRSFGSETTGDVIHTYRDGEEATLRRMKEIPKELLGNSASVDSDSDEDPFAIEFGEEDEFNDFEESGDEE